MDRRFARPVARGAAPGAGRRGHDRHPCAAGSPERLEAWLGPALYVAAVGLVWIWWINLFNFMDGIDGLAASEAAAIGAGLLLFASIGEGVDPQTALLAAGLIGAAIGFLLWNWSPAHSFSAMSAACRSATCRDFCCWTWRSRPLEDRPDPAALLHCRCDGHAAAPAAARRAHLGAAPPTLLSARRAQRARPCRGGQARDRCRPAAGPLRLGGGKRLGQRFPRCGNRDCRRSDRRARARPLRRSADRCAGVTIGGTAAFWWGSPNVVLASAG